MTGPRKTLKEQIADEKERIKQAKANLGDLCSKDRELDRKLDTRRKIIIGAAAMAHAREDRAFREMLRKVARTKIVREQDQAVVRDFLFDGAPETGSPERPESASGLIRPVVDPS